MECECTEGEGRERGRNREGRERGGSDGEWIEELGAVKRFMRAMGGGQYMA